MPPLVYFELKRLYGVSRDEIPPKPDCLVKTLDKIFGAGAVLVRRDILKELESSSGIKDLSKQEIVSAMRRAYHAELELV